MIYKRLTINIHIFQPNPATITCYLIPQCASYTRMNSRTLLGLYLMQNMTFHMRQRLGCEGTRATKVESVIVAGAAVCNDDEYSFYREARMKRLIPQKQ